jgi:hypothetical protein
MPLVVPGLQSKDGDGKKDDWMNKLMGKKLGESSDTTVGAAVHTPHQPITTTSPLSLCLALPD